jgi:hypothetical protein
MVGEADSKPAQDSEAEKNAPKTPAPLPRNEGTQQTVSRHRVVPSPGPFPRRKVAWRACYLLRSNKKRWTLHQTVVFM